MIRVEDLIEDIYSIYNSNPSYGFCSIDVVSMFDAISMPKVLHILSQLGMNFKDGIININMLLDLVKLDCNLLDYFKYVSPTSPASLPRYICQRQGIFMGGNTSTLYADLFMSFYIAKMKFRLNNLGVLLIRKYVDDLLLYMPKVNFPKVVALFHEVTGLDYTLETPVNGCLPYLDLMILDLNGKLSTTW